MEHPITLKFKIPRQDLLALSLFEPDTEAASSWAQSLPLANGTAPARLLVQALNDLNRTPLSPELRYNIMEVLRPKIDDAQVNLSKRFLNQPLIMPAASQTAATLSDKLLTLSTTAYTIVAIEAIQKRKTVHDTNPARLTCQAIQQALVFAGRKVLHRFQLQWPMDVRGWETLHQLYVLALNQHLADILVPEPLSGGNTITATYLQAIMISCCKPNQLLQGDLTALYRGLQQWNDLIKLEPHKLENSLFIVDLDSDQPPMYRAFYHEPPGPQCRLINCTLLMDRLEILKKETGTQGITFDESIHVSVSLLDHLIRSFGSVSPRNFKRSSSSRPVWLCLGLSSTHYHVAGSMGLLDGVGSQQDSPAAEDPFPPSNLTPDERYPIFEARIVDTSPGGYCVEWPTDSPCDIRVGEITGLKEDEGQKEWLIAVIRWLRRVDDAKTLIGIELISPRAVAYTASIQHNSDEKTAPIRVLLLPKLKLFGQPNTLITPRIGFRERQKITLSNGIESHDIKLLLNIDSGVTFEQFQFSDTRALGDVLAEGKQGELDGYCDSIWSKI